MKLSYNWLKEYVDINVSPKELAEGLTMSGSEVEAMEEIDGDSVMELEITSNRPDCLNIIGLAREASAVFDKDLKVPDMSISEDLPLGQSKKIKCIIKNKDLCPQYTARVITNVKVSKASELIKKRILALGLREVNGIVDITNFCLMETGQPLHAFDLDKIEGGQIIIREAVKGEKIVTIDDVERELTPGMLVIADSKKPIAIAGIMGGKDTEVTENTKNILLESAYFMPISIRQTARVLGLSSDSSYRFERGVDKGIIAAASNRAAAIISNATGGTICEFYDVGAPVLDDVTIEFDVERAGKILGILFDPERVKNIFTRLGLNITEVNGSVIFVNIPTFREDLIKEIDLVEEVARVHGYDNIPAEITKLVPQVERKEKSRKVIEKLQEILPSLGLNEIMTYSLISEEVVNRFADNPNNLVELQKPISEEHKILTPQLLGGMLKSIAWNINRKNNNLGLFEIGKIYFKSGRENFQETPTLCIGLTGDLRKNWQEGERAVNFYDIKGMIETILEKLKLSVTIFETPSNIFINHTEIQLSNGKIKIGFCGEVNKKILDQYDINQTVYICQIELDKVIENTILENHYHSVPRFPVSTRDVSILCDMALSAGEVQDVISQTGEEIIREVELLDVYQGKQIPAGKKSLSYGIEYGLDTRTLTDEEIESIHSKIKETLANKLKVTFR